MNTHIGLNAQLLSLSQSYRGAGISWYIYNLLTHLPAASPNGVDYTAFLGDRAFRSDALRLQFSALPTQRPVLRIAWEQMLQPFALGRHRIDLLHAMAFVAPIVVPCPFVVTVYDLSFLRFPEAFKPFNRWYLSRFTAQSVRRAEAVITISESTRQDVIQFLRVPAERVHTIYCGTDDNFRPLPESDITTFKQKHDLPETFILFLGTLEPRKNVAGLIQAYARLRELDPDAPPLVIAGGKGWHYAEIFALVEALNLTAFIRFPGYVPQEELPLWYNAATLFVYPSLFEGFGLPVLEAMACGTPVVTSTESSLPEVAGEAACLIPPTDIEGLATAMAEIINTPSRQAEMQAAGFAQASQFRWEQTAAQTVEVYQKVLSI